MKTSFYLFMIILFFGQIANAQESEQNIASDQSIFDSLDMLRTEALWKESYAKIIKQNTLPAGATALSCASDSMALVALYNATNGANWKNTKKGEKPWLSNQPIKDWYGVTVNEAGCVIALDLHYNGLTGTLPNEIGDLTNLMMLGLSINDLEGGFPTSIANLSNLNFLNVFVNEMTGTVDMLKSLTNMTTLILWGNEFTGSIPKEWGSMSNLEKLNIESNELTGEIPLELSGLTKLKEFRVGHNQFTGVVPIWIGSLTKLEELGLGGNGFTGGVPDTISKLTNLKWLDLSKMQLKTIPSWLINLSKLEDLKLYTNQFMGDLPKWFSNMTNLEVLDLSGNQLTSLPIELKTLSKMRFLTVNNNLLEKCPDYSGYFPNMFRFSVEKNKLTFDDLIPNKEHFRGDYDYNIQNKFGVADTITVIRHDNHTITLSIDSSISNNTYKWYRNGLLVDSTTTNSITIQKVDLDDKGIYYCKVTNPALPTLTLESNPITMDCIIPNDQCSGAILLTMGNFSCSNPTSASNIGATSSDNDSIIPPSSSQLTHDIWYQFKVPSSGVFGLGLNSEKEGVSEYVMKFYSGDCGSLKELESVTVSASQYYASNYNIAAADTTIYLRISYKDKDGQPGIFDICVFERPCKEPTINYVEKLSCTDTTEYYVDFIVLDLGDASSLTIFNDRGVPSINNISKGIYQSGPYKRDSVTNFTIQHNQNSICNEKLVLDGPDLKGNIVTNDEPCTAISLNDYIGSTYTYTKGNASASVNVCEPTVPKGSCTTEGVWANNTYGESIWFTFTAPPSGSISLEATNNGRVAIWASKSCNEILEANPFLTYALDPCGGNTYKHTISCLSPGFTYYLKLVGIPNEFDISIKEINASCDTIKNDQCITATAIPVATEVCADYPIYTNIGATNSKNDSIPPSELSTYGTDIWFSSVVPASGNLALSFQQGDECRCEVIIDLYEGSCGNLTRKEQSGFDIQREDSIQTSYFKNLTPGATVYYAMDFKNIRDTIGYFKMCVFDPACLPIEWHSKSKIACIDSGQIVLDVHITDLGTATSFSILNHKNDSIYYDNLTSTGVYQVGPGNRDKGIALQIIDKNDSFCNSQKEIVGTPDASLQPANNNMCDAVDLSGAINKGATTFSIKRGANLEDCEPVPPVSKCGSEDGWEDGFHTSTWASFKATSNNMALSITWKNTPFYNNAKVAIWKAKDCEALKNGEGAFIKGKDLCGFLGESIELSFGLLESGTNYFIQIVSDLDYKITLTASAPTEIFSCDGTDLNIPTANKKKYRAAKTIESNATITNDSLTFIAGASITLKPGFHVQSTEFHAYIEACTLSTILPERVAALAPNKKIAEEVQLQVAPNPFVQEASIRFYLPEASQASLYVFDLNGQLLTEQAVESAKGWNSSRLDASNLVPGMYLVVLQTPKGRWTKKVMVIQ